MAYTQAQLDEIQQVQEQRSLTRKSAIQFCTRLWKRAAQAVAPAAEATTRIGKFVPANQLSAVALEAKLSTSPAPAKKAKTTKAPRKAKTSKPAKAGWPILARFVRKGGIPPLRLLNK